MDEFKALNADILAISTDSKFSHKAWMNTPRSNFGLEKLNFPLGSDMNRELAKELGVLLEDMSIALRGTFIIDPNGVVQYMNVHNLDVGRNVDEILRVLAALNSGGLCPLNWKAGDNNLQV